MQFFDRSRKSFTSLAAGLFLAAPVAAQPDWDNYSDTWVATDALGRTVPTYPAVPAPRADRTVGIFYFLWLGEHIQGGPFDVRKILAADPQAMQKPDSPLWGPLHAPHHWGESLFGYYLTNDEGVLRKHAQMLSDAGVDVVIFDVTNQITYRDWYRALLRVWADMRRQGNRTPQVAFLTPFWSPSKVVHELWRDLYQPELHPELWFRWEGKPLILADPELVFVSEENAHQDAPAEIQSGHPLGQSFTTDRALQTVSARFATWHTSTGAVTLTLRSNGPAGPVVATERFQNVRDNSWLRLKLQPPAPAGTYFLEASEPQGHIGWWSHPEDKFSRGSAFADGAAVAGDRTLRLAFTDAETEALLRFFTFRAPQPDYFKGPTKSNMWSWLEVYPQHVFTNAAGQKEQMSVGIAQNAVNGRLGSMSEPGAHGRSFHAGATDTRPDAVRLGLNVTEQWARALQEDPRFIFVTGWNEWIMGRFAEFNGIKLPVMFVDQFDQEHSRDIEPMRGGHGDDYYYQFVSYVRKFKGARPLPPVQSRPITVDGRFDDWRAVQPEFRDTVGDPVHRGHRGWDAKVTYRNETGRNDIVAAKFSSDRETAWFYVRTRDPITAPQGTNWMLLFLDADANPKTGWLGYDVVVNRTAAGSLETNVANRFAWSSAGSVSCRVAGNELELAIPWKLLGLQSPAARLDFKWADNCLAADDWTDFTLNGDTAPNDRFNYRAHQPAP
ncbi:MAG TPA: hypothetical protein PKN95_08880 [Verrucomicrobiota bacterium]|nr:hypothetical protein [Verrucomicrobiota bacterium]HNT15718.1 hypothetical protein [Verrucomicrobiota bacterium]